jgi:hypothetical protein
MPKRDQANGFATPDRIANDADGNGGGPTPIVRANPMKSNAEAAADGVWTQTVPSIRRSR